MNEQNHLNEPEMKCVVTKRRQTSAELYHYDLQSAKKLFLAQIYLTGKKKRLPAGIIKLN
jgi:hypothetical protein